MSLQKLPTLTGAELVTAGSWRMSEDASGFRLAEPCVLEQRPSPAAARRWFHCYYFPFLFPFLIFWSSPSRCGVLGGMAVGGMQLLCREEMLPEHRGETEAEKCGVSDL